MVCWMINCHACSELGLNELIFKDLLHMMELCAKLTIDSIEFLTALLYMNMKYFVGLVF